MKSQKGSAHTIIIVFLVIALMGTLGFVFWHNFIKNDPALETKTTVTTKKEKNQQKVEAYKGTYTTGGDYQIKIPNGWAVKAGLYEHGKSYTVLLAGPNQLDTLSYDESKEPIIGSLDSFGWDGLAEYFYVMSQESEPLDVAGYTSRDVKLEDGSIGKQYTKILSKDDPLYADYYQKDAAASYSQNIYEFMKGDVVVRARLSLYSDSKLDVNLAEKVIKSIKINTP